MKPLLKKGFVLQKDKVSCYRVRGDIVDVVSVRMGRSIGCFYLYNFMNLLVNPEANHLGSFHIGYRMDKNPLEGPDWLNNWVSVDENESEIALILKDISNVASGVSLDYFDNIKNYQDYMKKVLENPNKPMFDYDEIICLSMLGEPDKALFLCGKNIERVNHDEDFSKSEKKEMINTLRSIKSSIQQNTVSNLFESWRRQTIEKIQEG